MALPGAHHLRLTQLGRVLLCNSWPHSHWTYEAKGGGRERVSQPDLLGQEGFPPTHTKPLGLEQKMLEQKWLRVKHKKMMTDHT